MELLLKFGFIGKVIVGTIIEGFLAMIVYSVARKLRPKNSLPISCVIAVLICIGFSRFLLGKLLFMLTLNQIVSGILAFVILRWLFKREIAEDQVEN